MITAVLDLQNRLYVRNVAIFAGMRVFEMATQEFGNPAAAAWAVLQFVALGFAVLLTLGPGRLTLRPGRS